MMLLSAKTCKSTTRILSVLLAVIAIASEASAWDVTVSWVPDRLQEGAVGYEIHYGTTSRWTSEFLSYDTQVDVGNVTEHILALPDPSTVYYIAIVSYDTASGLVSDFSAEVATDPGVLFDSLPGSVGTIRLNHAETTVAVPESYHNPVVIMGPPSYHGPHPGTVRVADVQSDSFRVWFQEWTYLDVPHFIEDVSYLVLEQGRHQVPDGSIWEVGTFDLSGTGAWKRKRFSQNFSAAPALFLTTQTANELEPITVRARNVTETGFEAAFFEEEALMDGHDAETVGYLAVYSPRLSGMADFDGVEIPYLLQTVTVDERFVPTGSFALKLEEETSADSDVDHTDETVSALLLGANVFAQIVSDAGPEAVAIRRLMPKDPALVEWGVMEGVDHAWRTVPLFKTYTNPVVVAGPVSSRGFHPGVIRVQDVTGESFQIRYAEWLYLDKGHIYPERVFYLVAEAGSQFLAGLGIEAGRLENSKLLADGWESVDFSVELGSAPAVFTAVMTENGTDAVATRVQNVSATGFEVTMQEEEALSDWHTTETLGWIAIEKGVGASSDKRSIRVLDGFTDDRSTVIDFDQSFRRRFPILIADMTTTHEADPCTLRYEDITSSDVTVYLQEEQSQDTEVTHGLERISIFLAE
jgi:hypothetical protein